MSDNDSLYYFGCLPLQGGLNIWHRGRFCDLASGSLGFVATNEEYVIQMSDDLDALWLRIPAQMFRSHVISADELLNRPFDISRGVGLAALGLMQASVREDNEVTRRGANLIAHSLLGFIGELTNSNPDGATAPSTQHRKKILARARDFIEQHLNDDELSPRDIAHGIGVSIRYLSEVFAAEGTSVMRWVQRRRLELCRIELERQGNSSQLICEIAYSMGFINISSFNRAFKAHFGRSPRSLMQAKLASLS